MGRILVIEDTPAIAGRLQPKLQSEGLEVTCASNEIEGERHALADDVSLVVLDLTVSGRHDLDLLTAVRELKPALPIIVLSSRAEVADRIAALDAGANDFLAKPFSPDELAARVLAQLWRARFQSQQRRG